MFVACDDDEGSMSSGTLSLQLSGITQLGDGYVYALWLREGTSYVLLGDFTVASNGILSQSLFGLERERLLAGDGVLLTLEVEDAIGDVPSNVRFMAGDFVNKGAVLLPSNSGAIDVDFSSSSASYILSTPTNGPLSNETSGLWYFNTSTSQSTLDLPALNTNWMYETWVTVDDTTFSLGKFSDPLMADLSDLYSGPQAGYNAPGGDLLEGNNQFPPNLLGERAFISVEPVPDDDASAAFGIRLFSQDIVDVIPVEPIEMEFQELGIPRGLVSRQ